MVDEMVDVLDENGNKTGIIETKKNVHKKGLWHQAAHIWIFNSKGNILMQKRSINKDNFPGLWDVSAAGHVSSGETPQQAALRELFEEIGIIANPLELKQVNLIKISANPRKEYYNNEFDYVFIFKFDGDIINLKFEDGEVDEVKFIYFDQLKKELNNPRTAKNYVPHGKYYFEIIETLRKELKSGISNN